MTSELVSPRDIRLLADNVACLQAIADARMEMGLECPRCGSANVHVADLRPNGIRVNPQFRCVECGYIIAATSGTFMMGARMMPRQYIQVFFLSNVYGDAVPKKAVSLATNIRSRHGLNNVLDRLRLVDPGIRFAFGDPERSNVLSHAPHSAQGAEAEDFFRFCESQSIVVNLQAWHRALEIIFTTTIPEIVDAYRKRGRPYATRARPERTPRAPAPAKVGRSKAKPKPPIADSIHGLRKALAQYWLAQFAESLPHISTKQRVALAWQLAALGIDSDIELQSLESEGSAPPTLRKPIFIELRSEYLQRRKLA